MASERANREPAASLREALVGDLPPVRRWGGGGRGRWAKPVAACAILATLGAIAYRFAAPRHHDFNGALDQAQRLVAEGRLAEAGSLLLGKIAPKRLEATPEESLRFETVHQAWLDAVRQSREAKPAVAKAEAPAEPPAITQVPAAASPAPSAAVPDGEETLRLAVSDADAGRHEAARMRFESAISLGLSPPSDATARLGLAETWAALGDHAAARARYSELARSASGLEPAFRELAAGSALDRVDAMLALGEFEAALGYAEVSAPLVVAGSAAESSLAVRRASTRLALANRLVAGGDREAAKPLARAAAEEFLRADGLEAARGSPSEGFASGTFARLASEAMRIVAGEPAASRPAGSIAAFLRAESRRDAGLAASRALLAATAETRDGLIRARLEAYGSALGEYDAVTGDASTVPDLAALAAARAVECLVALNRLPEAITRLEAIAASAPGPASLESLERGLELARHAHDAAATERLLAAARLALDAMPDTDLASALVPRSRAEWRRAFASTDLAAVPDRP